MDNFKKEDLRPCTFTLEGCDTLGFEKPGVYDYDNEKERETATCQRKGLFHTWETDRQSHTADGRILTVGIVEDISDGKVYHVPPENIQFTDYE